MTTGNMICHCTVECSPIDTNRHDVSHPQRLACILCKSAPFTQDPDQHVVSVPASLTRFNQVASILMYAAFPHAPHVCSAQATDMLSMSQQASFLFTQSCAFANIAACSTHRTLSEPEVYVQVRGMLNIAQPKSAKPLPPFEKWSFTEQRYIQYMCDQHNVHSALEEAVAAALRAGPAGPQPIEEVQASGECAAAFEALSCFGEDSGLDRYYHISSG